MDKNSTGTFTETAAVYRSSLIYILNVSKSKTNSKHHWQNKLGKQWKRFSASKKKTVNETLRMFTKCSTRKNNWEKSYKSAKSSYNFCSFADHSGYCRKRNQLRRSTQDTYKKIISANSLVKCSCKSVRYSSICSNSVAVSEKERTSNSHISKFKSCGSQASITYPIKPGGEGRKGRQKLRQRLYEEKNSCTQENLLKFGIKMNLWF